MLEGREPVRHAYFAAMNGRAGFTSFFEEIFFCEGIKKRYVIKGGPGTGKSSFMKRAALRAESGGARVEYYYCSSDTSSLDGIVIDSRIALLDGTSPHCYDTVLPGARDEIVNLGEFWRAEGLESRAQELFELSERKKRAYASAYGFLRASGEAFDGGMTAMASCVNEEKLKGAAGRLFYKLQRTTAMPSRAVTAVGRIRTCQISALGTCGRQRLDTLERRAVSICPIEEYYGTSQLFLRELIALGLSYGERMSVSYNAPYTGVPEAVLFERTGELFTCGVAKDGETAVNMKRFVNAHALSRVRPCCRGAAQATERLNALAEERLSEAGRLHGEIERIYVANMDFEALSDFCESFTKKLI